MNVYNTKHVTLRLCNPERVQRNIDALDRAIHGDNKLACDDTLLMDIRFILESVQEELKKEGIKYER